MVKYGKCKKNNGLSIVEMMIALSIIIIVAASLVPLMVFVTTSGHSNQAKITAGNLSLSVMEKIRAMDYAGIGTVNGNPSGTIPQLQENIELNGAEFDVETLISWGSAKENNEIINPVAYKNVRVIVKGINPFTNKKENLAELHSIVTRDGEEPIIANGHIRAWILDSCAQPIGEPSVHVEITSPVSQSMLTDYNGTALFGILDEGSYNVRAKVEEELMPSPKETVTDGWIKRNNVEVEDYKITDVNFHMEKKTNACHLIIKFIDKNTNSVITGSGKASLKLFLESATYTVYNKKQFTADDFEQEFLPADFSGALWPDGTYNIQITDVSGYEDYDLSINRDAFLSDKNELWNGEFEETGTTLIVTIPMKPSYFYEEQTKEDFEDNTGMEDLIATDQGRMDYGERLSLPIPLAEHESDKYLYIEWDAEVPEGTAFEIWTVVTDGKNQIPTEGYKKVGNGDIVPDIGYLENFENKYLWIKEIFTTDDQSLSPVLNWLRITEKGPVD